MGANKITKDRVLLDTQAAWGEVDFVICDMFLTYIRHIWIINVIDEGFSYELVSSHCSG